MGHVTQNPPRGRVSVSEQGEVGGYLWKKRSVMGEGQSAHKEWDLHGVLPWLEPGTQARTMHGDKAMTILIFHFLGACYGFPEDLTSNCLLSLLCGHSGHKGLGYLPKRLLSLGRPRGDRKRSELVTFRAHGVPFS